MIEWGDKSDRGSRFYVGELRSSEPLSAVDAVRSMFDVMCERVLGEGNAVNFDVLMFEVNCDTGRLISGASTNEGWKSSRTDGCAIRVQEIQDYWYDLVDAGVAADEFSQLIKAKVVEIARIFRDLVVSNMGELRSKAGASGFKFVVFGSTPGEVMLNESFCPGVLVPGPLTTDAKENRTP
jgi:hypothetical protein